MHNKLMCACSVMKIKPDVSMMMTISRVCELISFHIIIIRRLMRASCCSPQYLLTCCRKSAISLLISIHLADYSFIFLSHLLIVSTEAAKNDSEGKLKRREKFAKITWLSDIPDISSHLLSGFREFFHYSSGSWLNFTYHPESYRSITRMVDGERPGRYKGFFEESFTVNPQVYIRARHRHPSNDIECSRCVCGEKF